MDISITKQVAEIIENDDGTTREEEVGEPETITEINRVITATAVRGKKKAKVKVSVSK
ncbi:MAG: hypothetical protein IJH86_05140 [Clostridia bacterium]|nr:hypothetical protein [Clostridia bacterium]